jgi:hypothetical protein
MANNNNKNKWRIVFENEIEVWDIKAKYLDCKYVEDYDEKQKLHLDTETIWVDTENVKIQLNKDMLREDMDDAYCEHGYCETSPDVVLESGEMYCNACYKLYQDKDEGEVVLERIEL